jgi:Bifunctional DNA primase/polymerase, N-terminal
VSVAEVAPAESVMLRSALSAAASGWHVFPCAPGGKRPALRGNWQDRATTSADQICGWWTQSPFNIGIACGPSGLVVVDLDLPRAPAGEDDPDDAGTLFPLSGADRLARLARSHGERYPAGTYIVDTPSGGCHLYFAAGNTEARNTAGAIAPYIDVRAAGGYVIGAGSRIGGRAYTPRGRLRRPAQLPPWLARLVTEQPGTPGGEPAEATEAAARPWPADRAQGRAYAMAALRGETQRVAAARPGTRNDTLNRAAFSLGQLVAAGLLPPVPVITGLISAATRAGLPEEEAARTVRSGIAGGARKPRAW